MYKVYVGSTNVVKLEAVKEVFNDYEVIGFNVESGVSSQPFSDEETLLGALNRAKGLPKDGLRIGLEAGVQITNDIMYLVNFGVLIDANDNVFYAGGTRIPLPNKVSERLEGKETELSIVMDELYNTVDIKHKEGAIGLFTNQVVKRKDIFVHIVKLLYGQYLYYQKDGKI